MAWKKKSGAFAHMSAEWTAYRYGAAPKAAPTTKILRGQKREAVVEMVAELLGSFKLSPFQFEGAARAGLRSGFCMDGRRWAVSDIEAEAIVNEGLRRIGAKRPTWNEGQPEITDPNVFCRYCGKELSEEMFDGNRIGIFCSDACGAASFERRRYRDNWRESEVSRKAHRAALKQKRPARACSHCGTLFHPDSPKNEKNVYCSPYCRGQSLITVTLRPCIECGKEFRPQSTKIPGMFCSNNCRHKHAKRKAFANECAYCGEQFQAATADKEFCTPNHANLARRARLRIEEAERTGVPFVPTGKNAAHVQRIIDRYSAASRSHDIDTTEHVVHHLFDRPSPMPAPTLTAAAFDSMMLRAA